MSESNKAKIYTLIPKIMADIGAIGKTHKNLKQNYAFRGIDDMYNAVQPALDKHGVFCVPEVLKLERSERKFSSGTTGVETLVTVKYTFYADDCSNIVCTVVGEAMDSGDKSLNKAMSAAQKYCFIQLFCIPTEELKDSENDTYSLSDKTPDVAKQYFEGPRFDEDEFDSLPKSAGGYKLDDEILEIGVNKGKRFSEMLSKSGYMKWIKTEVEAKGAKCHVQFRKLYEFAKANGAI